LAANLICTDQLRQLLSEGPPAVLAGIITRATGGRQVAAWEFVGSQELPGCAGYAAAKAVARIAWHSTDGQDGQVALIIKHFRGWRGGGESAVYARLAAQGAPVPRCFGHFTDRQGEEVLVLERLPHVGFDLMRQDDRLAAARSLALLHRLDRQPWLASGYRRQRFLDSLDRQRQSASEVLSVLVNGGVGEDLIQPAQAALALLSADPGLPERLGQRADGLPWGLVHRDSSPQNAGWRDGRQELLWFDWHKASLGCTLADLLPLFPELARRWTDDDTAVAAEYRTVSGVETDLGLALPPLAFLRILNTLTWHLDRCRDGRVDWTQDRDAGRATYRGWTRRLLEELLILGHRCQETLP
jgi:hypothetical protein